ncbi:EscS/YscS/HrcS family type III secretion system export apparatus protein [Pseudomonas sp. NPDC090202]|uniref:EscS/YscS/HrcS family type III secretion system export apparatus protein n=1 Tax=unclassified Pseudomonas TaxID=196821 RepID=UPI0038069CF5
MSELVFAGNKTLYLILLMAAWPIIAATVVGLLIGLVQTVTQLQEQTLPFGFKLLAVAVCLFLLSGWYGDTLLNFSREVMRLALK